MNRFLKFNSAAQRIGLTSDLHFYHAKEFLYGGRGFKNVEEHNAGVIATLQDFDVLIHLGDMFLNATEEQAICVLDKIPGVIYTLWGNHNAVLWPVFKREMAQKYGEGLEVYPHKWRNIVFIGNYCEMLIDGHHCVLSHYPLLSWNSMAHGSIMCHGHEHSKIPNSLPDGKCGKILDVGWDVFKRPVTFPEILTIMSGKSIASVGHH